MADQARRFEVLVLRPLQVLFVVCAIAFVVKAMWLWLVGCGVAVFYLGVVGSRLHPLQSASGLMEGPLDGPEADTESRLLPPDAKRMLVGHACTRVAILLGSAIGVVTWAALGWHWYFALLAWWLAMLVAGGLLKFAFGAR